MPYQFPAFRDVAWDGSAKQIKTGRCTLLRCVVTSKEASAMYLHMYDSDSTDVGELTPAETYEVPPAYNLPIPLRGEDCDWNKGLVVTLTSAEDGSGDPPAENVMLVGRIV